MSEQQNWVYYGTVFPPSKARCIVSVIGKEGKETVVLSFFAYPDELMVHLSPEQARQLEQSLANANRTLEVDDPDDACDLNEFAPRSELEREEREPNE